MEHQRLTLTMKEKNRIEIIQAFAAGKVNLSDAARVLDRSERTVYRMQARLLDQGIEGLVHGNKGRPSRRATAEKVKKRILKLVAGKYADINDTHLVEILEREEGIVISREVLRQTLRGAGVKPKRRRRSPKYRSRRERKPAFGMMLQIDASPHTWLEERGPWLTLVGAIDDATNFRWARFVETENTWAYLDLMGQIFASHGLPRSLYSDRHSVFFVTREPTIVEQLTDSPPLTQFGRAMLEFDVRVIPASSPQAKGRVERMWGVLQDRLVVALRLAGAKTIEQANAVLEVFLADFNRRFHVEPKDAASLFRPAPARSRLDRILCLKDKRVVAKDHTVSFESLILQIPPSKRFHSLAGRRVEVLQLSDGSIRIEHRDRCVATFSPQAVARLVKTKLTGKTQLRVA
jgi:transposase